MPILTSNCLKMIISDTTGQTEPNSLRHPEEYVFTRIISDNPANQPLLIEYRGTTPQIQNFEIEIADT